MKCSISSFDGGNFIYLKYGAFENEEIVPADSLNCDVKNFDGLDKR
jgi:hypothetical protein